MNIDTWRLVLTGINTRTYAAVCLVCTEWRSTVRAIYGNGTSLCGYLRIMVAAANARNYEKIPDRLSSMLPLGFILSNPRVYWDVSVVMDRPDFNIKHVIDHPDFGWSYSRVSRLDGLTTDMIMAKIDKFWDFEVLLRRGLYTREMYTKFRVGRDYLVLMHEKGIITDEELMAEIRADDYAYRHYQHKIC